MSSPSKTDVFARKSSGLVRAASAFDASLVNLYVATFPIMVSFILAIVLPFYAGANVYLTLLIGALVAMPILITYAVASAALKRSGGDYVFISRMLHPALGFAANFVFVLFQILFLTSAGYYFCQWCLAPLFRVLGAYLGNPDLIGIADVLVQPLAIFIVSEIFVVGFGLLFIFRNTRAVLKVFRYTLPISGLGLLAFFAALLFQSGDQLLANFNAYVVAAGGVENAADVARQTATDTGFVITGFSISATLLAVTWPSFSLPYYLGSAYFAGEVRSAQSQPAARRPDHGAHRHRRCGAAALGEPRQARRRLPRIGRLRRRRGPRPLERSDLHGDGRRRVGQRRARAC